MLKNALVLGSSGGIGKAMVNGFKQNGWKVIGLSRSKDDFDITDEKSVSYHLHKLSDHNFDRIIVTTGALEIDGMSQEKSLKQINYENMLRHYQLNTLGPMLCLKYGISLLPRNVPSVFGVLSARVGSIGDNYLGGWHSYRMSKAALNQGIRGASIQVARSHPKAAVVALHPGTVDTHLTRSYVCKYPTVTPETCAENLINVMDNLDSNDTGLFYDYAGKSIEW